MSILPLMTPERVAGFWSRVALPEDQDACFRWTGDRGYRRGYGRFSAGRVKLQAHRVSLSMKLGREIAPDMLATHLCDTVDCVNPGHIVEASTRVNKIHEVVGGRHAHGERHGNAKLPAADVREIAARLAAGQKHDIVAAEFRIARATVGDIALGRTWRSVTGYQRNRSRAVPIANVTMHEIARAHFFGEGVEALAKAHGVARNVVREIARGEALPRPRVEAAP